MTVEEKFNFLFIFGQKICSHYTGFSKSEIMFCQQKVNWQTLHDFLMSTNPYEALIHFSLHPVFDVIGYFQMFIGCMIQFPDETENVRLKNLLFIIDNQNEFDEALTNSRMIRALLAISAKYVKSQPDRYFKIFLNCKRVLAHIFKKYPDYFKLNILKTNAKTKKLRFKKEDIQTFW